MIKKEQFRMIGLTAACLGALLSASLALYSLRIGSVGRCFRQAGLQADRGELVQACPAPNALDRIIPLSPEFLELWSSTSARLEALRAMQIQSGVKTPPKPTQSV